MALKVRSRREKVGSGLGLLLGILIFNLITYQFVETKALSETNRMIGAIVRDLGHPPFCMRKSGKIRDTHLF
ncbi:hypothetical protein [Aeromonas caviae]|uniref:hypothetical protein n=1 Tax=Aeromonas caviae TaxID=648 RepID=UPI002B48852B|nr:hypothetical protein [Aeromonas caviae]